MSKLRYGVSRPWPPRSRARHRDARELLERTAFGRAVAVGPNGAQRLHRLRELCLVLEQTAASEALDYDAVTARSRDWIDAPPQLDPPHPVGTDAIRVLTVHQAKGLEFPVVVLWDGKALWRPRVDVGAWRMERDGRGWLMNLDGLRWEEPAGLDLRDTEQRYLDAVRRRVIYVAATRARDLLVVPRAGTVAEGVYICSDLLAGADPTLVRELPAYRRDAVPPWAELPAAAVATTAADPEALEADVAQRWELAATEAARPRFRPAGVSGEAHAAISADGPDDALPSRAGAAPVTVREGRFGSLFGSVVHHAIGLVLRDGVDARVAVQQAAVIWALDVHIDEAVADVERAVGALRAEGIASRAGDAVQLEYPVAGLQSGGVLLSGYIDLVAVTADRLDVIDFKTDAPPGAVGDYPAYAGQVRTYAGLLEAAGIARGRGVRCGLLFTADGAIRWVAG